LGAGFLGPEKWPPKAEGGSICKWAEKSGVTEVLDFLKSHREKGIYPGSQGESEIEKD
jgi:hypothetical protein